MKFLFFTAALSLSPLARADLDCAAQVEEIYHSVTGDSSASLSYVSDTVAQFEIPENILKSGSGPEYLLNCFEGAKIFSLNREGPYTYYSQGTPSIFAENFSKFLTLSYEKWKFLRDISEDDLTRMGQLINEFLISESSRICSRKVDFHTDYIWKDLFAPRTKSKFRRIITAPFALVVGAVSSVFTLPYDAVQGLRKGLKSDRAIMNNIWLVAHSTLAYAYAVRTERAPEALALDPLLVQGVRFDDAYGVRRLLNWGANPYFAGAISGISESSEIKLRMDEALFSVRSPEMMQIFVDKTDLNLNRHNYLNSMRPIDYYIWNMKPEIVQVLINSGRLELAKGRFFKSPLEMAMLLRDKKPNSPDMVPMIQRSLDSAGR